MSTKPAKIIYNTTKYGNTLQTMIDTHKILLKESLKISDKQYEEVIDPFIQWYNKTAVINQEISLTITLSKKENNIVITINSFKNKLILPKTLRNIKINFNSSTYKNSITIQDIRSILLTVDTYITLLTQIDRGTLTINSHGYEVIEERFLKALNKVLEQIKELEKQHYLDEIKRNEVMDYWVDNRLDTLPKLLKAHTLQLNTYNQHKDTIEKISENTKYIYNQITRYGSYSIISNKLEETINLTNSILNIDKNTSTDVNTNTNTGEQ